MEYENNTFKQPDLTWSIYLNNHNNNNRNNQKAGRRQVKCNVWTDWSMIIFDDNFYVDLCISAV